MTTLTVNENEIKFPSLILVKQSKEKEGHELKEDMKIANEYDISEKEIKSSDKLLNKQYTGVKVKQRSYTNNDYCVIENKNNNYVVMRLRTTSKGTLKWLPLVFDLDNFEFIKNFDVEGETGNWNLANNYVTFSRKNGTTMFYLHNLIINVNPDGSGKEFCDHLNSITLDNRKDNLVMKTQSKQNNNQKTRKCASKSLYKMPEPYKTYFLENRPKFIYWLYYKSHGHRIVAGPVENIKEKKFSSKDPSQIPYLMKKEEDYLIDMAKQNNMSIDQITSDLEPKAHQLKREYRQIVLKESKILELNLPFYSRSL